jgi:hypothetical protein
MSYSIYFYKLSCGVKNLVTRNIIFNAYKFDIKHFLLMGQARHEPKQ